jgi:DNA-binding transcriptional MerR regulator
VSSRTYLSIGDVLTLLREEFPDVTISKIRFLESQGLVNPERSPSGYRKFFEADVERLRWVLRQQREHFLPLKVIRDRLADGDLSEGAPMPTEEVNGKAATRTHAVAGASATGRARTVGLGSTTTAARTEEQSTQADDDAMARILADATRRTARVPENAREHALLHAVPDPGAPHVAGPTDVLGVPRPHDVAGNAESEGLRVDPDAPTMEASAGATAGAVTSVDTAPPRATITAPVASIASTAETPAAETPAAETPAARTTMTARPVGDVPSPMPAPARGGRDADAGALAVQGAKAPSARSANEGPTAGAEARVPGGAAASGPRGPVGQDKRTGATAATPGGGGRATEPADAPGGGAAGPSAASTSGMVTGASMTSEELCAASGLSEIELAGLQGFGLIEPVVVAGIPTFDENALTVANLAAEFRKYGIEARHLRPYRNAVDREVGLIEQVIIPLLRQRNPESRQRAVEAADELGALGQTMRATLLRTALQRHVGG